MSWLTLLFVFILPPQTSADAFVSDQPCLQILPAIQAHRILSRILDKKEKFRLVAGQTTWGYNYCAIELSEIKADGGFEITAKEMSSDGEEIRSIHVPVASRVRGYVACPQFFRAANQGAPDSDILALLSDSDTELAAGRAAVGNPADGSSSFWIDPQKGYVTVVDMNIKPTMRQRFGRAQVHILLCR